KLQWGVTGVTSLLAARHGTIQPVVGGRWDSRGSVMGNVLSLQLARERAWQSVWNTETTGPGGGNASNQRLFQRLAAENAQLRGSVVELALQIHALGDAARTLTA